MADDLTKTLAARLAGLRNERALTLDQLAAASGVSRAALSRIEKAEVSPNAEQLGKLATAYGLSLTRLVAMVEEGFTPLVKRDDQTVWRDKDTGFLRRVVSPGGAALAGDVIECRMDPGMSVAYDAAPVEGQEHHLVMLGGKLQVELDGQVHELSSGDALRYRLTGPSRFSTLKNKTAKYLLFLVTP